MNRLLRIFGIVLSILSIVGGSTMLWFSMAQINMLTSPVMDVPIVQSKQFFTDLQNAGYERWREVPWTINMYFFPNMTAGEAYDYLMIVNYAAMAPIMVGSALLVFFASRGGRRRDGTSTA